VQIKISYVLIIARKEVDYNMDKQLIPFDYHGKQVRTVVIGGEPWFVAKDICEILDLGTTAKALERLDEDEKGMTSIHTPGGTQEMSVVSESGLYSLALGSKKPEAKPFKRWVTHDVIPTIRKTGTYSAQPMTQTELIAAMAQNQVELERKALEAATDARKAQQTADSANTRLTSALDVFTKPDEPSWRESADARVKKLCVENDLSYLQTFGDIYREAEHMTGRNIKAKQRNKRARMKAAGATATQRKAVSELCIVAENPDLKIAVDSIIRRLEAKYAAAKFPEGAQ